ncbi:MAG: hypothetical protein U1F07_00935 [Rubrivivax sp.]
MQMGKSVVPLTTHGQGGAGEDEARAGAAAAAPQPAQRPGAFWPLLLMALALVLAFGFQAAQLLRERQALQGAHAGQQQTVDNAGKLRASLDALAADTQRLADAGNPNAALLVNELRKRGITINPAAQSAPKSPSAASAP